MHRIFFFFFFFFFLFFSPLAQVSVCARVRPQICPSVPRCRAAPQVQLIHKIVGMRGVQRMFNSNFIVQAVLFVCTETGYATRYARENVTRTFIQNTATRFVCASRECNSLLNLLYPVSRPGGGGEKIYGRVRNDCFNDWREWYRKNGGEGGEVKLVEDLFYS